MEPPVVPDGEVTLAGAGVNHAVSLNDVESARRASVLAYCARLCDPASIAEAADAAFAEFRSALEAADDGVDLDRVLLEATRDAAAARVDVEDSPGGLVSRRSSSTCRVMPTLLAARASGRLGSTDREGVDRHLGRCARCRGVEQRRDEAERAYAALLGTAVPSGPPVVAAEPFAPGDPDPEVAATRAWSEPEAPIESAVDGFAGYEGVEEQPADVHAWDEGLEAEPAADGLAEEDGREEDIDAPSSEFELRDEEPRVAFDGWTGEAERSEPSRRGRFAVAAVILVGLVVFAFGLVQLLTDDGGSSSSDRPSRPAAQAPAPATPAATPGPSRTELRTRARLRSLGDRDLGPGTTGADVRTLQKLLGVQQTGNYGELTSYAVGAFQASHDLPSTGIADQATKRKLARRTRPPRTAPAPPASSTSTPPPGADVPAPEATTPPADAGTATPPSTPGQ